MSLLSGPQMHPAIDFVPFSLFLIDVCLVLQSDGKIWKRSQAPKYFVVYTVLSESVMEK